ncbi:MAG: ParA family protein [Nitrospira sp.]|nr:ParA family protein [Nitrospira sp.]
MRTVAFLHQKGGTGKTTLAIATAMALAEQGARVLLLDADVQGTASEWASHWGERFRVVARSQIQPIVHEQASRFAPRFEWMVVDGPPMLSDMTTSILRAADQVFVPVRPSYPDIWALEGVAALRATLGNEGINPAMRVVWNQVVEWPTSAMRVVVESKGFTISPAVIQCEAVWLNVMEGQPLTTEAVDCLMRLVKEP